MARESAVARAEPVLVVDWEKRPRERPQASLEKYAPGLALEAARRAREATRARERPSQRVGRQLALDDSGPAVEREVVEFELKPASRLTEVYVAEAGPARPQHRLDEQVRAALMGACERGATREEAIMNAARECAVPMGALSLVEGLLSDLVLEGQVSAYGDVLFSKQRRDRKLVAVEVGEDDLIEMLSKGHRVLELK